MDEARLQRRAREHGGEGLQQESAQDLSAPGFSSLVLRGIVSWNPEPGTRNLEPGTRNLEPGTWNPEPGTRNLEPYLVSRTTNPPPALIGI
jgi:hypothetical protein